jgi:hypothetical protein
MRGAFCACLLGRVAVAFSNARRLPRSDFVFRPTDRRVAPIAERHWARKFPLGYSGVDRGLAQTGYCFNRLQPKKAPDGRYH